MSTPNLLAVFKKNCSKAKRPHKFSLLSEQAATVSKRPRKPRSKAPPRTPKAIAVGGETKQQPKRRGRPPKKKEVGVGVVGVSVVPPPPPPPPIAAPDLAIATKAARLEDFHAVADLRLSVFAGTHGGTQKERNELRAKAWEKMVERRVKGATCLVAHAMLGTHDQDDCAAVLEDPPSSSPFAPPAAAAADPCSSSSSSPPTVLVGTLECSSHEFARVDMRPDLDGRRLYITEVAVSERMRRRGVALTLLKAAEERARRSGIAALYLHVDAGNPAALGLYRRAGFTPLRETVETYNFASALGLLSGAYALTKHVLMIKELDVPPPPPPPPPPAAATFQEADWCI